jgi:hypothetical protein
MKLATKIIITLVCFISIIIIVYYYCRIEHFDTNRESRVFVVSCFKNEMMNLPIWVKHYIDQGVNRILLIDNGSTDNPMEFLQPYIDKGTIIYKYDETKHSQVKLIQDMLEQADIYNTADWCINCDLDEFFFGRDEPLSQVLSKIDDSVDCIYSQWYMFGSDGLKTHPTDIRTKITHRTKEIDTHTKYIFRPNKIKNMSNINVHNLNDINGINVKHENDEIRLYHYPIQSEEYFRKIKMTRGDVSNQNVDNIRDMAYFEKYDKDTDFEDITLKLIAENGYNK